MRRRVRRPERGEARKALAALNGLLRGLQAATAPQLTVSGTGITGHGAAVRLFVTNSWWMEYTTFASGMA